MTNREFLNAIVRSNINSELTEFAQTQIEKLDSKNEKRKTSFSPKQKENEKIKADIISAFPTVGAFASEIGKLLDISTSRANALLGQLEDNGIISSVVAKTPSKTKAKFYTLVNKTESENETE